jgi:hypothetical protein
MWASEERRLCVWLSTLASRNGTLFEKLSATEDISCVLLRDTVQYGVNVNPHGLRPLRKMVPFFSGNCSCQLPTVFIFFLQLSAFLRPTLECRSWCDALCLGDMDPQ